MVFHSLSPVNVISIDRLRWRIKTFSLTLWFSKANRRIRLDVDDFVSSFLTLFAGEVEEEVGVVVSNVRYVASQPWPFPHSLMLGFTAQWVSGDIVCDPVEIMDANWYKRDELPMIPPAMSIARRLIDDWVYQR
jgi:hypothetical protein